ncbi:MAG TPA: L,D-transpeptidase family protein [Desulfobacteria bacterium]|nr:L,D-transpeptidase family protein [Desulfobacteria bacterium]
MKILIDIAKRSLYLTEEKICSGIFPVAVGTAKTPTPVGIYCIAEKARWGGAFGTRWMKLNVPWGTYGIHGTNKPGSIGQAVSHGCIRMHNRHVEEIYDRVDVGTEVEITGPLGYRVSVLGSRGKLVQIIQTKLREQGYYRGECHGIFDHVTEQAVRSFQTEQQLVLTGQVMRRELAALGILGLNENLIQPC